VRPWSAVAGFAVLAIVAACSSEPDDVPLYSEPEYDGLSREEIESRAEAMTPAEAELLGIVDTTIRIEAPMNPDSVLPLPVDTLVRP